MRNSGRFVTCMCLVYVALASQYFVNTYLFNKPMDEFSHKYVADSVARAFTQGDADVGGFMVATEAKIHVATVYAIAPEFASRPAVGYISQYGLQYTAAKWLSRLIGDPALAITTFELLCLFMTSLLLAVLYTALEKEFGSFPAGMVMVAYCLSKAFSRMSGQIYWVIFLLIAPFCLFWRFYPELRRRGSLYVGLLAFVLLLIRTLVGYEFVTMLLLSMLSPIIYYELRDRKFNELRISALGFRLLTPMVAGVLGVLTAAALHIQKAAAYFGSLDRGFKAILFPASYSAGAGSGVASQFRPSIDLGEIARIIWFQISNSQYFSINISGFILAFAMLFGFGILLRNRGRWVRPAVWLSEKEQALVWATLVATVASLSWGFVMTKHWMAHPHLTWMLYVSVMLPAIALLGSFVFEEGRRLLLLSLRPGAPGERMPAAHASPAP